VGWAAVTGSLSPLAWVLFAIIFLWTPPHFWALALILRRQYAAANVPMLPVVVGGGRTRRAIVAYTIPMVGVSLVPWLWLGPAYGVAAGILGGVFLMLAWRASLTDAGHAAVTLFHYSLAYLALLFAAASLAAAVRF
jgi:protoheme IX farnesyltransferase